MPSTAVADTYRVVSYFTRGAEVMLNVNHVRKDAGGAAERLAIANHFKALWEGTGGTTPKGMKDFRQIKVVFQKVSVQDISTLPFPVPSEYTSGTAGTSAGIELPAQTALVVSLKTGLAGRSYRGRTYVGGFTTTAISDDGTYDRPSGAVMVQLGQAFGDLASNLNGDGTPLVVASRSLGTSEEVTEILVDNKWDTQRRRANKISTSPGIIVTV